MFFLHFSFFILIFVALTRSQEFIRVGYYVSNEYTDPELQETPPGKTFVFSLGFKNFVIRLLLQKQRAVRQQTIYCFNFRKTRLWQTTTKYFGVEPACYKGKYYDLCYNTIICWNANHYNPHESDTWHYYSFKFKINWDGAASSTTENGTSQQVRIISVLNWAREILAGFLIGIYWNWHVCFNSFRKHLNKVNRNKIMRQIQKWTIKIVTVVIH